MPSYDTSPPTQNSYARWDEHDTGYKMAHPYNPSSYDQPRSRQINVPPVPPSRPRYLSKHRWPPSPFVEDEAVSLAREFPPTLPDFTSSDGQRRGELDQGPVVLEVGSGVSKESGPPQSKKPEGDWSSLGSKSSTDSLGPHTPPDSDNPDRRFVWRPEPGIDIPASYDEPKAKKSSKEQSKKTEEKNITKPREITPLDTKSTSKAEIKQIPLKRESSPYAYSSNSGKSTFSGDYLLSPESVRPTTGFSTSSKDSPGRPYQYNRESGTWPGRDRSHSGPNLTTERPVFGRTVSAMGYPGEPSTTSAAVKLSGRNRPLLQESDLGPEESEDKRIRYRNGANSFVRSELHRQGSIPNNEEYLRQSRQAPVFSTSPVTPQNPYSATWDRTGPQTTRSYGSNGPATAPMPIRSGSKMPPAAHHPSRPGTPHATPPPSPHTNTKRWSIESPPPGRRSRPDSRGGSRPTSRPVSPFTSGPSPTGSSKLQLPHEEDFGSHRSMNAPRSRHTSPLPSPDPDNRPGSRASTQPPSPATDQKYFPVIRPELPSRPGSRESAKPFILGQPPPSHIQGVPHMKRTLSGIDPRGLVPQSPSLDRRSSELPLSPTPESASRKTSPSPNLRLFLPVCARPNFSSSHTDWYTLPSCPDFDICPPCRKAIEESGFKGRFVPAAQQPYDYQRRCDLSIPWVRMAWLLILQNRSPNPNLLRDIMAVAIREPPCPGSSGAVMNWHRLHDPEVNRLVSDFDVCPYCVRSLETIFPNLKNTFFPAQMTNPNKKRTCDLRVDSFRFPKYIDLLEVISCEAAQYRRPPNMFRFVKLAKKMIGIRECKRDDQLLHQAWHFMPRIPEFTVCEECYDGVVWPAIKARSELASEFNRTLQPLPSSNIGVSCQLYSPRMKHVFARACERNDWQGLRAAVVQRVIIERDLQRKMAQITAYKSEAGAEEIAQLVEEWKKWE